MKVYWLSDKELSEGRRTAIYELHGYNTQIIHKKIQFPPALDALIEELKKQDGFCYVDAKPSQIVAAALNKDLPNFGFFESTFVPAVNGKVVRVYHIFPRAGGIYPVWITKE